MLYAIRYFFILFCSIYAYIKILNLEMDPKGYYKIITPFTLFLSILMQLLSFTESTTRLLMVFLLCYIFLSCYTHTRLNVSFTVTTISFALSYITLAFAGVILSLFNTIFVAEMTLLNPYFIFLGGFLQFLFLYKIFRVRRFQKGMPFLCNKSFLNGGLLLSLFVITLYFMIQQITLTSLPQTLLLFALLLLATAVICWWRRKITQGYMEKLRISELESLYEQVAEKEREIENLLKNNDFLARIIHKDNKLIPAMEMAVANYLTHASTMPPKEAGQYGADLLLRLQNMSADREGILNHYHEETNTYPQVGLCAVDAVLSYMEKRARSHGICYQFKSDRNLKNILSGSITEADVSHLLSDVIENSIQAITHNINTPADSQNIISETSPEGCNEILIHLGIFRSTLFLDISDSGVPFDPSVYQDFGNRKHTTHGDSGGSGIGLMDIWNLKRKYKFSIHIYEYPPETSPYTKKIRFLFDRKNHFLIQSCRAEELNTIITRSDLHVFPWKVKG